ncbi:MAG: protein kinase [Proteobacteria bacterium]|nr:protein kinase [Pseudomonadota bacterium]
MRLLLIEDDARLRSAIRHGVGRVWPDARIEVHQPDARGALPPEFLAQGYDVVLLGAAWPGGEGLAWLQDLAARRGFAPVIYLATDAADDDARRARIFGAFGVIDRRSVGGEPFIELLREASITQQRQLSQWRGSPEAEQSRRFGSVRIPGYRCIRRLAGGSFSQLFLAEHERIGSLVVVKVTPSLRDPAGIDQSFERFLQEYEIARPLQHSNIVRCHELGVADDHAYLSMDYFPDGDLRRRLKMGLSPEEALALSIQIARALRVLHDSGALHRDLKPGNVLMRGMNQLALTDFGLAKQLALDAEITDPGLIFGTPHYMSPEQGHGEDVDLRTDFYSLGVILYEMLVGEKPFTDKNSMAILYKHRHAPIPRLPDALRLLQPLIDTLLAKLPADRPATAQQVEQQLYTVLLQLKGIAA